jgi:hypothetical protein
VDAADELADEPEDQVLDQPARDADAGRPVAAQALGVDAPVGVEDGRRGLADRGGVGRVDDPQADAARVVDPAGVGPQRRGGDGERAALVAADLEHLEVDDHPRRLGEDLAAVRPDDRGAGLQRLEARLVAVRSGAAAQHGPLQQLQHGLEAERARHDRVLEEVGLEEPLAGVDVELGAGAAEAGGARRPATSR